MIKLKQAFKKIAKIAFKLGLLFLAISVFWVVMLKWINPPITPLMLKKYLELPSEQKQIKHIWVDLDLISTKMPLAVVAAEDQKFYSHSGFDVEAIKKAIDYNKEHKRTRGASTISQQTAKNVFCWPSRNWLRKGFELYFTFLIELFWSKDRIMEVYLNVIEFGPGVYGVEKASNVYFKRNANKISTAQCALLAAVLPNPIKFSAAKPSAYTRKRQNWVQSQMGNLESIEMLKKVTE